MLGMHGGEVQTEDRVIGCGFARDSLRFDAARLAGIPVRGRPGVPPTPLGSVATVRDTSTRAELLRENQRQMIVITGRVEGRSLGPVVNDVRAVLAANPPPRGVTVELGGQYASQQESFRALLLVLVLAALSVVTVMVVQFSSFVSRWWCCSPRRCRSPGRWPCCT
jgi:multidrug efflux pump subunit AcrB